METDVFIKEMYKILMRDKKNKLDKGEIESIELTGITPSLVEEIFGKFEEYPETNGADVDYWARNSQYIIFGSMYTGYCRITKKGDDE